MIILLFLYQLLLPNRLAYQGDLTSSDVTELNFPRRDLLARSLKHGHIPTWTTLIGNGYPLLGEGQTGIFYPPNLVLFTLLDPVTGYNLSIILSLVMALSFMYLFARSLERSRAAALFAGVAFANSAFFITRLKFMAMINAAAWIPLALYAIEKLLRKRKLGYAALAGFALSMQLLASQTQIFYISALLSICYLLFRFAAEVLAKRAKRQSIRGSVKLCGTALVLIVVVAFALSAIQLMPTIEGSASSNRAQGLSYSEATAFPLHGADLVMFVLPYRFGNPANDSFSGEGVFWENCAFCGIVTLALALLAAVALIRKEGEIGFWVGASVLGLLIALGSSTPIFKLLWGVMPGMRLFRFPQRFLLVVIIALAVLASRGFDFIREKLRSRLKPFTPALLVILVLELFLFSFSQVNAIDSKKLLEPPQTLQFVGSDKEGEFRTGHIGDLVSWRATYNFAKGWSGDLQPYVNYRAMLHPDFNMVFNVECPAAQGNYGVQRIKTMWKWTLEYEITDERNWVAEVPESVLRMMGAQNVRYVMSPFSISNEYLEPVAKQVFSNGQREIIIYRNLLEAPRVYVAGDYELVRNPEGKSHEELFGEDFDPLEKVMLESPPSGSFARGGRGTASIMSYEGREAAIDVSTEGGGLLVLADTFYPGWQAYLDGREVETLRANFAFRAVEVPDGEHSVVFRYTPRLYMAGFLVTLTTFALLAAWLFLVKLKRRLGSKEIPPAHPVMGSKE